MPAIADISPMLRATRAAGNSSRMIPKQSGKMPPPTPCRTRPATTTSSESVSADTTDPAQKAASATTSSRRLPNMSPRRPTIGVKTAAATR
jgi:hypothetical protein